MERAKVLVVDNSPVVLRLVAGLLEKENCLVQTAADGLEALDVLDYYRPDIIFTDLVMPKIDGAKLCAIIRSTPDLQDIFLVILSGIALEEDIDLAEFGADMCIAKGPATPMKNHILAALSRWEDQGREGTPEVRGMTGLFRREVTSELLTSKRHQDVILRRMSEGVVELDGSGRIVMVNQAAQAILGQTEIDLLADRFSEHLQDRQADRVRTWIESRTRENLEILEFPYEDPLLLNGRQITFKLVPIPEEEQLFFIGILQDVTGRKEAEERQRRLESELERVRKLDAMATMASGISHDFNNLLTIINGNLEMARMHAQDDSPIARLLDESGRALELTTGLIHQFTTFSDNYLPARDRVELHELLERVLEEELRDTGVDYRLEQENGHWTVDVDVTLMQQVFHNIIQNSVEAMGGRGRIRVGLHVVSADEVGERSGNPLLQGDMIEIVFTDQGPGIDPAILDRIFDPYFSTKQKGAQKGMGLGLTIVHSIVKKHGGLVRIESEPGQGCTVRLYLPAGSWAEDLSDRSGKEDGWCRILIFDGDEMMRLISRKMFEFYGCTTRLAASGREAVELYRQAFQASHRYGLVMVDMTGDDGLNGQETVRHILEIDPDAAVVAVCSDSSDPVLERYAEHGFTAAVEKPFSIDVVKQLLHRFVT